jgi:hypothetical protein
MADRSKVEGSLCSGQRDPLAQRGGMTGESLIEITPCGLYIRSIQASSPFQSTLHPQQALFTFHWEHLLTFAASPNLLETDLGPLGTTGTMIATGEGLLHLDEDRLPHLDDQMIDGPGTAQGTCRRTMTTNADDLCPLAGTKRLTGQARRH